MNTDCHMRCDWCVCVCISSGVCAKKFGCQEFEEDDLQLSHTQSSSVTLSHTQSHSVILSHKCRPAVCVYAVALVFVQNKWLSGVRRWRSTTQWYSVTLNHTQSYSVTLSHTQSQMPTNRVCVYTVALVFVQNNCQECEDDVPQLRHTQSHLVSLSHTQSQMPTYRVCV